MGKKDNCSTVVRFLSFLIFFCLPFVYKIVVISERKILGEVKSIGDFFRQLLEEGVLKKSNVIILQYLLRAINRPDLEEMCVKYATTDKQALCFYEDPNSHGNY